LFGRRLQPLLLIRLFGLLLCLALFVLVCPFRPVVPQVTTTTIILLLLILCCFSVDAAALMFHVCPCG
jgi:hypothetical protein